MLPVADRRFIGRMEVFIAVLSGTVRPSLPTFLIRSHNSLCFYTPLICDPSLQHFPLPLSGLRNFLLPLPALQFLLSSPSPHCRRRCRRHHHRHYCHRRRCRRRCHRRRCHFHRRLSRRRLRRCHCRRRSYLRPHCYRRCCWCFSFVCTIDCTVDFVLS